MTEFYTQKYKDKVYSFKNCKPCSIAQVKKHYNKDSQREYRRKIKPMVREGYKDTYLKKTFNISLDDYNNLKKKQNNYCSICNKPEHRLGKFGFKKDLAVDHCHSTGKVRGLLCQNCNTGLGLFKDDKETLAKAIKYLK